MRLTSQRSNYFLMSINNLLTDAKLIANERHVSLVLTSITIEDLEPNAAFRHIVSLNENSENLFEVQVKMLVPPRTALSSVSSFDAQCQFEKFYFRNYLDVNHCDLSISAAISKLRFLFIYRHVNTLTVSQSLKLLDGNT